MNINALHTTSRCLCSRATLIKCSERNSLDQRSRYQFPAKRITEVQVPFGTVSFCSEDSTKSGQSPAVLLEILNCFLRIADFHTPAALVQPLVDMRRCLGFEERSND